MAQEKMTAASLLRQWSVVFGCVRSRLCVAWRPLCCVGCQLSVQCLCACLVICIFHPMVTTLSPSPFSSCSLSSIFCLSPASFLFLSLYSSFPPPLCISALPPLFFLVSHSLFTSPPPLFFSPSSPSSLSSPLLPCFSLLPFLPLFPSPLLPPPPPFSLPPLLSSSSPSSHGTPHTKRWNIAPKQKELQAGERFTIPWLQDCTADQSQNLCGGKLGYINITGVCDQ